MRHPYLLFQVCFMSSWQRFINCWDTGGIPPDGTPLNVTSSSNFAMAITYFVLASAGIVLVLVCCAFNIGFRYAKLAML